jgi:flagellar hook protein FlgE
MALTGAFATGLSGLNASSRNLDVIGNNIANVNTPAFKSSRALFTTQFLENLGAGSPPTGESGGTNPVQIGLGTRMAGVQTNFNNGGIQATGVNTHMAIEGGGFFVVEVEGEQLYTRDGQFQLNSRNELVTATGGLVRGFGIDDNYNIVPSVLENIEIPIGSLTIAEPTANVNFEGNLNASGPVSTGGSIHNSRAFFTTAALTGGTEAAGTEDLTVVGTDLYISDGAGGSFLALEGGTDTVITLEGIEKAGQALDSRSFAFTDAATAATLGVDAFGSTLDDYVTFLDEYLGLDSTAVSGQDLGGSVALTAGQIVINGNEGSVQDLRIETTSFIASNVSSGIAQPLVMSKTQDADGESARTTFVVYDSLGTPLSVDLSMVKQANVPGGGTIWEWVAESNDNDLVDRVLGLGVVEFDSKGLFVSTTNDAFSITRANGATTPLTVTMDFDDGVDSISALTDEASLVAAVRQDGSPIGTLDSFSVGEDGVIIGSFTNGLARTIGQFAMASFINNEGMVALGNNFFSTGANSGNPVIGAPAQFGAGRVISNALEQSNVDLASEFVDMITASTGFSAASRVITTADDLLQQLLLVGQ